MYRFLPYVGYVTIAMVSSARLYWQAWQADIQNDFPQLKYALLGCVGLFLLVQKETS
jgi:signal peptidase